MASTSARPLRSSKMNVNIETKMQEIDPLLPAPDSILESSVSNSLSSMGIVSNTGRHYKDDGAEVPIQLLLKAIQIIGSSQTTTEESNSEAVVQGGVLNDPVIIGMQYPIVRGQCVKGNRLIKPKKEIPKRRALRPIAPKPSAPLISTTQANLTQILYVQVPCSIRQVDNSEDNVDCVVSDSRLGGFNAFVEYQVVKKLMDSSWEAIFYCFFR